MANLNASISPNLFAVRVQFLGIYIRSLRHNLSPYDNHIALTCRHHGSRFMTDALSRFHVRFRSCRCGIPKHALAEPCQCKSQYAGFYSVHPLSCAGLEVPMAAAKKPRLLRKPYFNVTSPSFRGTPGGATRKPSHLCPA